MQCPVDGTELKMGDRQGVEIDYCPECRGVWLDRGELDKIVERERSDLDDFEQEIRGTPAGGSPEVGHAKPHKKKKRGSFLEDFLDFG
jgi:uncharacterized protein